MIEKIEREGEVGRAIVKEGIKGFASGGKEFKSAGANID